jgi:hypothetical protein
MIWKKDVFSLPKKLTLILGSILERSKSFGELGFGI